MSKFQLGAADAIDVGPTITLTASGPQGVGKTLLLNAIQDFLATDEMSAPLSLTLFRQVYGPFKVVMLAEEQT